MTLIRRTAIPNQMRFMALWPGLPLLLVSNALHLKPMSIRPPVLGGFILCAQ
jgi:hypothetical protein